MENTFVYNSEGTFKLKALIRQHFIHRVSLMIKSMDIYATQEEIQILITDFISNSEIKVHNCLIDADGDVSFEIYVTYMGHSPIVKSSIEETLDTMYNAE